MSVEIRVPTILRTYTDGQKVVDAAGDPLADLLVDLDSRHPGIRIGPFEVRPADEAFMAQHPILKKQ